MTTLTPANPVSVGTPHHALVELHYDAEFGRADRISPALGLAHELAHIVFPGVHDDDGESSNVPNAVVGAEIAIAPDLREMGFAESPRQANVPGASHPGAYYDYRPFSGFDCSVSHSRQHRMC